MDKVLVTITGLLSIAGIYWFFFGNKEKATEAAGSITITVDGGYKPKLLRVPKGAKTTLIFLRKDTNSCLEELVIPDFKIKKYLPMHTPVTVVLSPAKPGIYNFHCGMNMFHGTIEVNS
jgi:plastocyanin domain-containing protein